MPYVIGLEHRQVGDEFMTDGCVRFSILYLMFFDISDRRLTRSA